MDLIFLGTSSGTPTRTRNVSGLALQEETGKGWHLVDCGEATQHQVLRTPLSLHELRAIFITHVHGDHCYGLPGLLASAGMQGRKAPLEIVAPDGIEEWVRTTLRLTRTWLAFELNFHAVESLGEWRGGNLRVEAVALSHRVPSHGYSFTEARPDPRLDIDRLDRHGIPRGPLWGQLARGIDVQHEGRTLRSDDYLIFGRPPRRVVVGGDNDRPGLLAEACRSAQVLVHEATYTQAVANDARADFGHSTAAAVAAFAQAAGIANLVLTHFSARYQADPKRGPCIEDIRAEAAAAYRGRLFLAEDFARFRLGRDGELQRVECGR
ncbi:MBL fold metallo-hydrolase [Azotobacter chroococcum subsp. isscasi]|uniref:MBL fold metallo-hydrolase n=1 Tax=Azotobacter chroococcum TaxID=353 RepID=UPI00103874E8|nr:MBL fold metallo-hydrolase [Azotobacter chroococcum]TBW07576.1 MBL fold metallo-hydrolase [Azotobacter chroococcum subsp. isscasi]